MPFKLSKLVTFVNVTGVIAEVVMIDARLAVYEHVRIRNCTTNQNNIFYTLSADREIWNAFREQWHFTMRDNHEFENEFMFT